MIDPIIHHPRGISIEGPGAHLTPSSHLTAPLLPSHPISPPFPLPDGRGNGGRGGEKGPTLTQYSQPPRLALLIPPLESFPLNPITSANYLAPVSA
ncbi:hypothetical protein Mapa_006040 [Marchantia paleacea]|nr:hypothetical protein Mapa_006040 [Marchantia paleacea]